MHNNGDNQVGNMKHLKQMSQHDELGDALSLEEKNGKYEILLQMAVKTKNYQMLKCSDDSSKTYSSGEMLNMMANAHTMLKC